VAQHSNRRASVRPLTSVLLFLSMVTPGAALILAAVAPVSRYVVRPELVLVQLLVGAVFSGLFALGAVVGAAGFLLVARHIVPRAELEACFVWPQTSVVTRFFASLFRALCPEPHARTP